MKIITGSCAYIGYQHGKSKRKDSKEFDISDIRGKVMKLDNETQNGNGCAVLKMKRKRKINKV